MELTEQHPVYRITTLYTKVQTKIGWVSIRVTPAVSSQSSGDEKIFTLGKW